jgi:dTMP kinase
VTSSGIGQTAPSRGKFIVLEGIDGSGTTTQGNLLVLALAGQGVQAIFTHEPSKGPFGQQLRQLLSGDAEDPSRAWDCMALLFAADRLDHVAREIEPALASGVTVVCDRYDLSSLAYQSATSPAGEAILPWLRTLNARAPRPDLTLVLDIEADLAERRRALRGGPAELYEKRDLQRRLTGIYAVAERLVPGDRIIHVSADGSVEEVQRLLYAEVARVLEL